MPCMNVKCRPRRLRLAVAMAAALGVAACGSDSTLDSGGGAGDGLDLEDLDVLSRLVGVFDLTGNWSGTVADTALLVIRAASSDAVAEVLLYDIDESIGNCTLPPIVGEIVVDRFLSDPQVFLNDIFDFDNGILSLTNSGDLLIDFSDVNDIDGDGTTDDRVSFVADAIGITEQDVPEPC